MMRKWVVTRHEDGIRYRVIESGTDVTRTAPITQLVYRECVRARVVAQALNYAYELGQADKMDELADAMFADDWTL